MRVLRNLDELMAYLQLADSVQGCESDMSVLQHSLQCADILARDCPDDNEMQVAGLLHDIGYVLEEANRVSHPLLGAELIKPLFSERIIVGISLHSEAKRYLVVKEDGYEKTLTAGSRASLIEQGGGMSGSEQESFKLNRYMPDAVALRRADEAAKDAARPTTTLDSWKAKIARCARSEAGCG